MLEGSGDCKRMPTRVFPICPLLPCKLDRTVQIRSPAFARKPLNGQKLLNAQGIEPEKDISAPI